MSTTDVRQPGLPPTRPASPWREGTVLFADKDGKLWPYEPPPILPTRWIEFDYFNKGTVAYDLSSTGERCNVTFHPWSEEMCRAMKTP